MQKSQIDISIIIVNYKVKEYIANLLNSLFKARHDLELEIFVVDNASGDDSVSYLKERFPGVNYIQNEENAGFGKANNQAIKQARGKYSLLINPDTLVSEDTLDILVQHMQKHEKCGAAGCKIMNPDGTFAPESRRSVPTIWSAACKVFGLNYLFPRSKIFGQYYLSWLDEDEASKVPVLSGSFMFWRTSLLKELGGFDERFFMYAEDIDLCYRVQETEFHIDYVPETSIIHYKGESTKKGDLKYIRLFNKALYQFFDKQYSSRYSFLFKVFIYLAIWLRTVFSFTVSRVRQSGVVITDLVILNLSLLLGFAIRFSFNTEIIFNPGNLDFLWINLLFSIIYFISAGFLGLFRSKTHSISAHLKALLLTYSGVILITFFARSLAFSRLIFAISFVIGVFFTLIYRFVRINSGRAGEYSGGKIRNSKVIIVANGNAAGEIASKIHSRPDWSYEVIGVVGEKVTEAASSGIKKLGSLPQLQDLAKAYKADQIFFALNSISYKQMLREISALQKEEIAFKLIPDSMDFILGKSKVEYMEAIPLVEVEFDFAKPVNRFLKRALDLAVSIPLFLILLLFAWPSLLFTKKIKEKKGPVTLYREINKNRWKNRLRLFGYVIKGRISLVGSPIPGEGTFTSEGLKKGITGILQVNQVRIQNKEDEESFELYYLQNYSIWMDIDILMRTLFNGPKPLDMLARKS